MKTAFVTLLGTSAAMASEIYMQEGSPLQIRVVNAGGSEEFLTLSLTAGNLPVVSGGGSASEMKVDCVKDERSTTLLTLEAAGRPPIANFRGEYVNRCTVSKDSHTTQIIPPHGAHAGDAVLIKDHGDCAEISYTPPTTKTLSATNDGTFTGFVHGSADDSCPSGRRATDPDTSAMTANVEFTAGVVDSRLLGPDAPFTNGVQVLRHDSSDASKVFNLGIANPNENYFVGACENCFGAVKVEWMSDNKLIEVVRSSGFTLENTATSTVHNMKQTNASPKPEAYDIVLAEKLYTISEDTASPTPQNLITGKISCGASGGKSIPAYVQGNDRIAQCRQKLPTSYPVQCNNDGSTGAGEVEGFPYDWDESRLGQFATEPTGQSKDVLVDYEDFGRKVEVEWDDGYKALVTNGLTLLGATPDPKTSTRKVEWREKCDITMKDVTYSVTFKQALDYAAGPTIAQGATQQYQKFAVTDAVVGLSNAHVSWCTSGENKISDCLSFGAASDATHKDHIRIRDTDHGDFRGCKGANAGDIGDHLTFASTDSKTYLPSKVVCGAVTQVDLGSIYLDYGLTFTIDPFANTGDVSVSEYSSLTGAVATQGYYFSETAECRADGEVNLPADSGCESETLDTYNKVRDKFASCGANKIMYVNQHVTFNMTNDGTILKFCNSKKLSYTLEQQDGVLTASIAAAQRIGYDASVVLENLRWEKCAGGYEQVMLLNFETDSPETLSDTDMVVSTNDHLHKDDAATDLGMGRIVLRSSCVDVCTNSSQLHQDTTTTFTVDIGDTEPEFKIISRIAGNPCGASQLIDAVPDMELKVNAVADTLTCGGRGSGASDLEVEENEHVCFRLQTVDSSFVSTGRKLTTSWTLTATASDGTQTALTNSLVGAPQTGFVQQKTFEIPPNTYGGQQLTLHVDYVQSRDSGNYRRLRATYVLGAKNDGDAEASFRVLPSHISVADSVADAEIKPAEDSADAPKDNLSDDASDDAKENNRIAWVGVGLGGFGVLIVIIGFIRRIADGEGVGSALGRSVNLRAYEPVGVKAKRVGRFSSATRY